MNSIQKTAEIFKALSDPTRLKLVLLLGTPTEELQEEACCGGGRFYCVGALAKKLGVTQSAVSQHLRVLRQVGLVRGVRQGKFMHYTVAEENLQTIRAVQLAFE